MKTLKTFGNIIIGIILFALVFSLIFIRETNKIISSDVLKESITSFVNDTKDGKNELSKPQKDLIDNMFKDTDAKDIISLILVNYKEYRNDINYSLSDEDIKTFYDFLYKYRDHIKDSKIENMDDLEFEEYFNKKKIEEMAFDTFKNFDKVFDSNVIDKVIDGYSFATSYYVRLALLFVIVFFIILLCIINWSLIKWMVVFGISLIVSGCIFNLLYNAVALIKEFLLKDSIDIRINLNSFLLVGILQIILGIALIIIHYFLNNKLKESEDKHLV